MRGSNPEATLGSLKKLLVRRPKLLPARPQRNSTKKKRKNWLGVEERSIIQ